MIISLSRRVRVRHIKLNITISHVLHGIVSLRGDALLPAASWRLERAGSANVQELLVEHHNEVLTRAGAIGAAAAERHMIRRAAPG